MQATVVEICVLGTSVGQDNKGRARRGAAQDVPRIIWCQIRQEARVSVMIGISSMDETSSRIRAPSPKDSPSAQTRRVKSSVVLVVPVVQRGRSATNGTTP